MKASPQVGSRERERVVIGVIDDDDDIEECKLLEAFEDETIH